MSTIAQLNKAVGRSVLHRGIYRISVMGDSLSAAAFEGVLGEVHPEHAWPVFLNTRLGTRGTCTNYALSGTHMSTGAEAGSQWGTAQTILALRNPWIEWDIYWCQGFVNMIREPGASTVEVCQSRITAYVAAIQANKPHNSRFKTVICTHPPASGGGVVEASRVALNSWIRAGSSGADYVQDWDLLPELQNPNDLTYFAQDGLHLAEAGENVIAVHADTVVLPTITANGPPV